jgi:hypothetical protein
MAAETITITILPEGGYSVSTVEGEGEEPGHEGINETVGSIDEVLALVRQELADDVEMGMQASEGAAWDAEAASRDEQGYRRPGPAMSM